MGRSFLLRSLNRGSHAKQYFTALKLRSPSAGHFRCAVGLFRYQPFPHVSGKAKLFGFSDGFGSHRSGWQPSCLRQSLRCPGSPIVTIEIVARQFCHFIVLPVSLESQHGLPQCFAPRASLPPVGYGWRHYRTLSHRRGSRSDGDRSNMPTRQRGPLVNIAHYREFDGIIAIRCSDKSL